MTTLLRLTISFLLTTILNVTVSANAFGATVVVDANCYITIKGRIDKSSTSKLESALQTLKRRQSCIEQKNLTGILGTVQISGPGGDVASAISMGTAIRREQLDTWAVAEPSCVSACVLVFLGGVARAAFGDLGLHRAFSPEQADSVDAAQAKFEDVNRLLRNYFTKMNIPLRLLDVMNSISPGEIRLLKQDSESDQRLLKELLVIGTDPVFEDMFATRSAKMIGISKSEYFARMQRAEAECFARDDYGRYLVKEPIICRAKIVTGTQ